MLSNICQVDQPMPVYGSFSVIESMSSHQLPTASIQLFTAAAVVVVVVVVVVVSWMQ